jgi:aryl-alcohol dehydrogenase-like predicted oxidoreductase
MRDERSWKAIEELRSLGEAHGKTISQIALAWLLSRASITSPIIGPRSIEQLEDNLGSTDIRLSMEEIEKLEEISSSS